MEGSCRRDSSSVPVLADLTATHGCENESDSDLNSNSSLTVENSERRTYQIGDSAKDHRTSWTDEKHDLYLDHLESSFVEQLHQSIGVLAWCSEHDLKSPYLSQKLHAITQITSEQQALVQGDCSKKIDLKRSQSVLNHATDSLIVLKSHHRCASKQRVVSAARNLYTGDEKIYARHGKSFDCIGEFSDQNFPDETTERMCVTTMSKRSKTIV